jgi:hypothetical protein
MNINVKIYKTVILHALYGCETVCGSLRKDIGWGCLGLRGSKLQENEEICIMKINMICTALRILMIELRMTEWMGHVAHVGGGEYVQGFGDESWMKEPASKCRYWWGNNIEIYLTDSGMNWSDLVSASGRLL